MAEVTLLGIIGNTLHLGPFYGGDHAHKVKLTDEEKLDLLNSGCKEYDDEDHIMCQLYNIDVETYRDMLERANDPDAHSF
jgi:hypothetical protein